MPYPEPAMAGLKTRSQTEDSQPVCGVAYLLSHADFVKIVVTEGAGLAYVVIQVIAEDSLGATFDAYTFISRQVNTFAAGRFPSRRYKDLLLAGAYECGLPKQY
ncbi:hypothetical protein BU23DRAFT_647863 [Bimuria novae-zelandiae CBS 107.79]|uniref:Uncharacterized protein n=1 Tax=Bimuria novae-zelandiae CBS 107.79 TaxID=1447943 RepID=A0A6A5VP07_9PLEO|nr:hypothetical protein BU23DRAFT_647863 [Bimuria novae-zelandiae CBS 107.79]